MGFGVSGQKLIQDPGRRRSHDSVKRTKFSGEIRIQSRGLRFWSKRSWDSFRRAEDFVRRSQESVGRTQHAVRINQDPVSTQISVRMTLESVRRTQESVKRSVDSDRFVV